MNQDPVLLEIYKHAFAAIADEMGIVLQKTSFSPNIKERRDFSCALFDASGRLVSQAAHIPVHLGSMPLSVASAIAECAPFVPGDQVILNDPYRGGTHLPDITLVAPVFIRDHSEQEPFGYVACRAHHADVGGAATGSMSITRELFQEGIIIPPVRLFKGGVLDEGILDLILANVRTAAERQGDLLAQIAANQRGLERLTALVVRKGIAEVGAYMDFLIAYTERMTRQMLLGIPDGRYAFTDYLDDDGIEDRPIAISVEITVEGNQALVDFGGSSPQVTGSLNAVFAITLSAVYYVFRALIGLDVPNNAGCLAPVKVIAPEGSVVNARYPAPVAGGNVETSQRIVDVLLGALAQALPHQVPAASQGTMNNLTIGGWDSGKNEPFTYYETIGGGMGARPYSDGPSAIHSHMTNTLNTPVEALEFAYPLQVLSYQIRRGSGGSGRYNGGDGMVREIKILVPAQISLITDRRTHRPYGLNGGEAGEPGQNTLIRNNEALPLPSKGTLYCESGDVLQISTPGGGGWGKPDEG